MSTREEMVAFTVRLAPTEYARLVALATAELRSLTAEARRGIVAHLDAQRAFELLEADGPETRSAA